MNKQEFAASIKEKAGLDSTAQATMVLDVILESIQESLAQGESVNLRNFGTFTVRDRKARQGRNPQTGATIQIAATKVVHFAPGRDMKETATAIFLGRAEDWLDFKTYVSALDRGMYELEKQMKKTGKDAEHAKRELSRTMESTQAKLTTLFDEAREKLGEISDDSGEAWTELKTGLERAYGELRVGMKRAADKF